MGLPADDNVARSAWSGKGGARPNGEGQEAKAAQDHEREEEFGFHTGAVWSETSGADRFTDQQKSWLDEDPRPYPPWPNGSYKDGILEVRIPSPTVVAATKIPIAKD